MNYRSPQPVGRLALANARPKTSSFKLDGKTIRSVTWPMEDGGETSASPAAQHQIDLRGTSSKKVLANLRETLELPGTVSDYHFAIQATTDALWSRRHSDPSLIETAVDLSTLDVELIEAHPEAIRDEFAKEESYYSAPAFERLTHVYLREGLLRDALRIARLGRRFDQAVDVEEVEGCVAASDAEGER